MRMRVGIAVLCAALAVPPVSAADAPGFAWPEGKKAAVSLAYDDALASQLDNAIPALDRYGLKGTFFLPAGLWTAAERMDEWRAAARNGHELGNHTLFHQCSGSPPGRDWVQPHRDLDTTTAAQMLDQVLLTDAYLQALDGRTERTFTSPCGERTAEDGDYVEPLRERFVAIKVGGGSGVPDDMLAFDRYAVAIEAPVGLTGRQLIERVEEAVRRGTMAAFTFHGIGGDYMSVSVEAHEELLAYLAKHRETIWTDTFIEQMRWVRDRQAEHAQP